MQSTSKYIDPPKYKSNGSPSESLYKKFRGRKIIMEVFIIRYQARETKELSFVQVMAENQQKALGTFKRLVTDYVDETPTFITRDEYREIRENYGLNPNGADESELTPIRKKFLEIASSEEWKKAYGSGGYEDY